MGRLTHPLRYDAASDRYVETTWDEAFAAIGAQLRKLDPKDVTFYASGKASLETSYLYALFARIYGRNNLPDSSNMCHETTSVGLKKVLGSPVGTCTFEDLENCDMIIHVGQNPGTNSPRILHPLKDAAERGCKILAINPLKEKGLIEFVDPQNPVADDGRQADADRYAIHPGEPRRRHRAADGHRQARAGARRA